METTSKSNFNKTKNFLLENNFKIILNRGFSSGEGFLFSYKSYLIDLNYFENISIGTETSFEFFGDCMIERWVKIYDLDFDNFKTLFNLYLSKKPFIENSDKFNKIAEKF